MAKDHPHAWIQRLSEIGLCAALPVLLMGVVSSAQAAGFDCNNLFARGTQDSVIYLAVKKVARFCKKRAKKAAAKRRVQQGSKSYRSFIRKRYRACKRKQDSDGDNLRDKFDPCPNSANNEKIDTDGDGIGDTCVPPEGIDPTPIPTPTATPSPTPAQQISVLFIGNSLTSSNNLPLVVSQIAESDPDVIIEATSSTPGGHTLQQHSVNNTTLEMIQNEHDIVVLQEQSAGIAFHNSQPHVSTLNDYVQGAGGEAVLYMTWGYTNSNFFETSIADGYYAAGSNLDLQVVAAGEGWQKFDNRYQGSTPPFSLYSDDRHPSIHGTYLTAYIFYAYLTGRTPVGTYAGPLSTEDATILQEIAWETYSEFSPDDETAPTPGVISYAPNGVTRYTSVNYPGPHLVFTRAVDDRLRGNVLTYDLYYSDMQSDLVDAASAESLGTRFDSRTFAEIAEDNGSDFIYITLDAQATEVAVRLITNIAFSGGIDAGQTCYYTTVVKDFEGNKEKFDTVQGGCPM